MIYDSTKATRTRSIGATALEAAICLPIIFLTIFGIIDFSRYLSMQDSLSAAASQAATLASVVKNLDKDDGDSLLATAKAAVETAAKNAAANFTGQPASSFSVSIVLPASPRPISMRDRPIEIIVSNKFKFVTPPFSLISATGSGITITRKSVAFREQPWSSSSPVALDCRGNPIDFSMALDPVACACDSDPSNPRVTNNASGTGCQCFTSNPPSASPIDVDQGPGLDCQCPVGQTFKTSYRDVDFSENSGSPSIQIRQYGCACPNSDTAYTTWCPYFNKATCTCSICDPNTATPDPTRPNWCQCTQERINYCASIGKVAIVGMGPSGERSGTCFCSDTNCPVEQRVYDPNSFGTICGCPAGSPTSCSGNTILSSCSCQPCPTGSTANAAHTACECPATNCPQGYGTNIYAGCACTCNGGGSVFPTTYNGQPTCEPPGGCPAGSYPIFTGTLWTCVVNE